MSRIRFHFYSQWQFCNVNWIDFNFFILTFEWNYPKTEYETFDVYFGLLGLNVSVYIKGRRRKEPKP